PLLITPRDVRFRRGLSIAPSLAQGAAQKLRCAPALFPLSSSGGEAWGEQAVLSHQRGSWRPEGLRQSGSPSTEPTLDPSGLPSPWGEGQGEGDRDAREPAVCDENSNLPLRFA